MKMSNLTNTYWSTTHTWNMELVQAFSHRLSLSSLTSTPEARKLNEWVNTTMETYLHAPQQVSED